MKLNSVVLSEWKFEDQQLVMVQKKTIVGTPELIAYFWKFLIQKVFSEYIPTCTINARLETHQLSFKIGARIIELMRTKPVQLSQTSLQTDNKSI